LLRSLVSHYSLFEPFLQVRASKFLNKVSHIRPKFKLGTRNLLRDDNDLHPYSQRHKRIKSEAVRGAATGGASLDTESGTDNTLKPYMSQPLLNLNEMTIEPFVPGVGVIRHVDDQRRTKISGLPCEAEEAEASLLHVAQSYDAHHPLSSERPKPPVQPVKAVRFPAPTSTITSGEGGSLNTTQDQRGNFTGPAANSNSKRTARKKQDICDDDVPLMVLKERVDGHRPAASDNSEAGVGPPKSTTLQT